MQAATRNKSQSTSDLEDLLSFETDAHEGSPEEILLNTGDWHGLYQKLTDTSINPSQRREILLQAFAHPNLLAVVKNSKNAELTDSEKTLLLHIISYQDHQVLDRFYEIVDGYATATCELIIAHDANKDAREKFGIERLAKKRSVLNNPYLLEKLLQHPEARAIIAEADIQQEGFWDKFVSTIFPEPESEETYARNYNSRRKFTRTQTSPPPEPQFDWKLTNVEIYTLVIRLAKNGAITDSSALIKILKRATDLPNHLLKNMRSELFTSIASTARTWDNVTEKNDISSILKNEITKTHRPGHSDKHSSIFTCWSEEFFSFIRLFLTNQGLPIAQDVITILKYLHTQRIGFFSE